MRLPWGNTRLFTGTNMGGIILSRHIPQRWRFKLKTAITLICLLLNLWGCSTSPAARLQNQALGFGFGPMTLTANGFTLLGFYNPGNTGVKRLHVYLEGDGKPWEQGLIPAAEPTTRSSVMLPLMAMDEAPSLYLGRPCYNGHANDLGCETSLWTDARYGELVVSTLTAALQAFCQYHHYPELVLIGHSGGGSLAMLMTARLPQTRLLISLAANYDIDAWAAYHGYQRLSGSLNPAFSPNSGIPEWHFLAAEDTNTPPELFFQALSQRQNSRVEILPQIHHSDWQAVWPTILRRFSDLQ